ncbi:serine/threonine protein kinase [Amycolatopsis circi]|uniref:serine/threonine protein kinase n=1 Tax=Amycolatopsis circi TaxID=871959 RepID=UPI000E26F26B|nr:serine/threonine protein kinase [Amycolatopsis circi]
MSIGVGEERLLAEGPVAKVYAGRLAGEDVAVKVFDGVLDRDTAARFDRERKALAAVRGERAILPVDEAGELSGGRLGVRMELCRRSLAHLLGGQLPVSDVLAVGWTVSAALAAAHQVGVVHGGVTPHNVLLRRSGELALADFGLALRRRFPRDPLHAVDYAAPETLRDDALSEASDLYGLGAVLYTALSGSSPFPRHTGQQRAERILQVFRDPVPPIRVPGAPPALVELIGRLLAKDPADRPQDPAAVAETLERLYRTSTAPAEVEFDDFAGHGQQVGFGGMAPQPGGGWAGPAPQLGGFAAPQQQFSGPGGAVRQPGDFAALHHQPGAAGGAAQEPSGWPVPGQQPPGLGGAVRQPGSAQPPSSFAAQQHQPGTPGGTAQEPNGLPDPGQQPPGLGSAPQPSGDWPGPAQQPNGSAVPQQEPGGTAQHRPDGWRNPASPLPGIGHAPHQPDSALTGAPQEPGAWTGPAQQPGSFAAPRHQPGGSSGTTQHQPDAWQNPTAQLPGIGGAPPQSGNWSGSAQQPNSSAASLHQTSGSSAVPQPGSALQPNSFTAPRQPSGSGATPQSANSPDPATGSTPGRTLLHTFDDTKEPRHGRKLPRFAWWPALAAGLAAAVGALIAVPMLTAKQDPRPALPLATAPSSGQLPPAERAPAPDVHLALAAPTDLGTQIKLSWTAEGNLDFAVVVGAERIAPMVLVANRNRTMSVPVDPARKYCFQIRATDGSHVYETPPVPIRGAVCTS